MAWVCRGVGVGRLFIIVLFRFAVFFGLMSVIPHHAAARGGGRKGEKAGVRASKNAMPRGRTGMYYDEYHTTSRGAIVIWEGEWACPVPPLTTQAAPIPRNPNR